MASDVPLSNLPDDLLLAAALKNNLRAWEEFTRRYTPFIAAIVARRALDLSNENDLEDICAEVWARLDGYNSARGTVKQFITGLTLTGIREVWAHNCLPGQPKRLPSAEDRLRSAATVVPLDEGGAAPSEADTGPLVWDKKGSPERLDAKIDIDLLLANAPMLVSRGLRLMYAQEMTVTEAADAIGTSRSTLKRHIDRFAARMASTYSDYLNAA